MASTGRAGATALPRENRQTPSRATRRPRRTTNGLTSASSRTKGVPSANGENAAARSRNLSRVAARTSGDTRARRPRKPEASLPKKSVVGPGTVSTSAAKAFRASGEKGEIGITHANPSFEPDDDSPESAADALAGLPDGTLYFRLSSVNNTGAVSAASVATSWNLMSALTVMSSTVNRLASVSILSPCAPAMQGLPMPRATTAA